MTMAATHRAHAREDDEMDTDLDHRDVIATATAQGHLDWVRDLIAHRAPEIGPADIADAYGAPTEPDDGAAKAWAEIVPLIMDAIGALDGGWRR
jgi:hypothetical protein